MRTDELLQRSLGDEHFSSHIHTAEHVCAHPAAGHEETPHIPHRYDEDRCALLMVNPRRVFFYWELSGETRHRYGIDDQSRFLLCIMHADQRLRCEEVSGEIGSYYATLDEPFGRVYALLLWIDPQGGEHVLLRSKELTIGSDTLHYPRGELWYDKNGGMLLRASLSEAAPGSSASMSSTSYQEKR